MSIFIQLILANLLRPDNDAQAKEYFIVAKPHPDHDSARRGEEFMPREGRTRHMLGDKHGTLST